VQVPTKIADKIPHLPESPGVYLMKDRSGEVIYVGKAKRLRSRVRSYFGIDHGENPKTSRLIRLAEDFETIVLPDEAHALILEANLIKEYKPRFNIQLRDDKSYPHIKVTLQEPFPRVIVTRRLLNDGARYFGPYTDVGAMRRALQVVRRIFTVRSCNYDLPNDSPERPCLDYHIGKCKAPCVGWQSVADYRVMIDEVVLFLEGKTSEVMRRVRERMNAAAEATDFERAAELRDALFRLERLEEPKVVVQVDGGDRDVVGYARDGDDACVTIMRFRGGRLLARDHRMLDNIEGEDDASVLTAYLTRSYVLEPERAGELLVPFDFEDREALEATLKTTRVAAPQRGPKRELVSLADENARHLLEELKIAADEAGERAISPIYDLQRELGLLVVPRRMVCFDISTAQGRDTVGSCVWFENGRAKRAEYRKFRIKTVEGTDDFAAMAEVVGRYFRRRIEEQETLPDLVVVDGGKGQLNAAHGALAALGQGDLPIVSLAKREEEVYILGRMDPLRISRRSSALRLLQQARDEAHRFAITYNRQRRAMRTVTSELLKIPGVGPAKRRALLSAFGSLQSVREATVQDIAALPGFSEASAQRLLDALRDPTDANVTIEAPVPTEELPIASSVESATPDEQQISESVPDRSDL
jgi:excinuclease ABC subunit C